MRRQQSTGLLLLVVLGASAVPFGVKVGQDPDEEFALYQPPEVEDEPLPLGVDPTPLEGNVWKGRAEVHRDGDWHRAVHVWITDGRGNLLMQYRSVSKDTFPSMWDVSCAGHMGTETDSVESAVRELKEELGLDVDANLLRKSFIRTLPSSKTGLSLGQLHGRRPPAPFVGKAFCCNEYQDLYLLTMPELSSENLSTELTLAPEEVEAVELQPAKLVFRAWTLNDDLFVPRTKQYIKLLSLAFRQNAAYIPNGEQAVLWDLEGTIIDRVLSRLYDGLRPLLGNLQQNGHPMGIVSNAPGVVIRFWPKRKRLSHAPFFVHISHFPWSPHVTLLVFPRMSHCRPCPCISATVFESPQLFLGALRNKVEENFLTVVDGLHLKHVGNEFMFGVALGSDEVPR